MFSHHDLAILVLAMTATLCRAMDIDSSQSFSYPQQTLSYQMQNLFISEEPMEVEEKWDAMEIEHLTDEMDVDFYKQFNFMHIRW